jgi:hypothetical protein
MTALSSAFTSYISYGAAFFVSSAVATTSDPKIPDVKETVTVLTKDDAMTNFVVNILLFFFDKIDVVILNGEIYLHGLLLTHIFSLFIAVASLFCIFVKGGIDVMFHFKKMRLDKLEREIAELGDE